MGRHMARTNSTATGRIMLNRVRTFLSKPQNVILLLMGIVLTASTVAPIVAIVQDTIKIHPGTIDNTFPDAAAAIRWPTT